MKKWQVNVPDKNAVGALVKETGLSTFICSLLVARGIYTRARAEVFFNSEELSDPFLIKDMKKAVETVSAAVENGDRITIYGDYDCDGVTSTYMLHNYLEALGAEVSWYIPTRDEGYGLNKDAVELLHKRDTKLIITVDNGISAIDEAELIYELGMKLVITDHHQVPEELPRAEAVVDPHRHDDPSPCKDLAGCGVVLKLIAAMEGDTAAVLEQYGDMAAIGTIGDVVDLSGENRIIVRKGMECIERTENPGLMQLIKQCGEGVLSSTFIAFSICPRINAAGRYGSPAAAMELFLCTDMNTAYAKAKALCEMNDLRRGAENDMIAAAEEQIRENPDLLSRKILIVCGDGWRHGVIGITSARLLHKYGKPNIVITKEGETSRGSARSTDGLPLYDMLESCSELLIRFGGHTKAAGLTVRTEDIGRLTERIYAYCDEKITEPLTESLQADMILPPDMLTLENAELAGKLEPFGEGNREPLFLLKNCVICSKKPIKEGKYVMFIFDMNGTEHRAVFFGSTYAAFPFEPGDRADIMAALYVNEYNDTRSLGINVKDIRTADFDQDRYFAARTAYEEYRLGRVDKRLLCRMAPTKEEMRAVYDILRVTGILSYAEQKAGRIGINCCKFRLILDVLAEFGLAERDITKDSVRLIPSKAKADLTKSKVLAELNAAAERK